MRPTQSLGQLAAALLSLSTVVAAWPGVLPPLDALVVRQADTETAPQPTATATDDADRTTITRGPALTTGNLNTAVFDPDNTSGTGTGTRRGNSTTTKRKTFDARLPAGGVSMIEPATTTMVLFKLGDFVTFKWNYTSLLADPTAVDVYAVDASASQTHTLTQNMTFEVPAEYTWDTERYQEENAATKGLRVAQYTILIHDSDGTPTDTPESGYLAPYKGFQFGIYTPQPYQPLDEWVCAICNSAPGKMVASAAGFAVTLAFGAGVAIAVL